MALRCGYCDYLGSCPCGQELEEGLKKSERRQKKFLKEIFGNRVLQFADGDHDMWDWFFVLADEGYWVILVDYAFGGTGCIPPNGGRAVEVRWKIFTRCEDIGTEPQEITSYAKVNSLMRQILPDKHRGKFYPYDGEHPLVLATTEIFNKHFCCTRCGDRFTGTLAEHDKVCAIWDSDSGSDDGSC